MAKTDKEIAYALKEIIDKNGPEYMDTLHNGTENDEDMILVTQDIIFPRIQRKQIIRTSHI